jgi:phosphoglycerate dehydrogenase-like enzyme
VQTIGYDPILPKDIAAKAGITAMELDQMWPQCDFITLHTPLTEQTRGLMNDAVFNKCVPFRRARGVVLGESLAPVASAP